MSRKTNCTSPYQSLYLFNFERVGVRCVSGAFSCWLGGSVPADRKVSTKSKIQEEARFQILRLLHENPELTQRELGERVGISLGAVNYLLKAFAELGLLKVHNFKKTPKKIVYAYLLTPEGIAEKTLLTGRFLRQKIAEYEALRAEIVGLEREHQAAGQSPYARSDL